MKRRYMATDCIRAKSSAQSGEKCTGVHIAETSVSVLPKSSALHSPKRRAGHQLCRLITIEVTPVLVLDQTPLAERLRHGASRKSSVTCRRYVDGGCRSFLLQRCGCLLVLFWYRSKRRCKQVNPALYTVHAIMLCTLRWSTLQLWYVSWERGPHVATCSPRCFSPRVIWGCYSWKRGKSPCASDACFFVSPSSILVLHLVQ